jgi:glycosyltransferase involved in cell wall biosynthesis
MRLSIIGPAYPLRGGIAHHVYRLRQGLIARGHAAEVISFRKLYPTLFFPGSTEMDESNLRLDAGAKAMLSPLNPRTWLCAIKEVKSFAADAVVFQWWQPFFAPVVGALARAFGKAGMRRVIECHNIFPHEASPLDRSLLKFAFKSADRFITHSNKDRELLATLVDESRISVSPLPALDEFRAPHQSERSGRRILFFGKVRKYKGLETLLKAMPKALREVACELVIAGEFYDSVEKYRKLIRELGIESNVRIINRYIPNEEVPAFFEQADVLALPYTTASQSAVARIALSNALPIISSDAGGLSETVTNDVNGLVFPARDSNALANSIVRYFSESLGPRFAENLRSQTASDSTLSIIEAIETAAQPEVNKLQRA